MASILTKIPPLSEIEPWEPSITDGLTLLSLLISGVLLLSLLVPYISPREMSLDLEIRYEALFTLFFELFVAGALLRKYPILLARLFSRRPCWKAGLAGYVVAMPLLFAAGVLTTYIFFLFGREPAHQNVYTYLTETKSLGNILLLSGAGCIIAPFAEEVIFRGVVYRAFRNSLPAKTCIALNGLLFAAFHLDISNMLGLFVLGCVMAYLVERHNSLWPCITLHLVNNLFATTAVLALRIAGKT